MSKIITREEQANALINYYKVHSPERIVLYIKDGYLYCTDSLQKVDGVVLAFTDDALSDVYSCFDSVELVIKANDLKDYINLEG